MRAKFFSIVVMCILLFSISACSSSKSNVESPATPALVEQPTEKLDVPPAPKKEIPKPPKSKAPDQPIIPS